MPVRLEFIGREVIHRDPMKFLAHLREQYPNVSEKGIHAIAKAEFEKRHPRHDQMVVHLLGRDILTDDLTTMAAWAIVDDKEKAVLARTPLSAREALVDPPELSRTYVWRLSNGWVQEVTDHDVEVIRRSSARGWFRDIDRHGPWVPKRTWDLPVKERYEAPTMDDARRFVADITRKKQWNGV